MSVTLKDFTIKYGNLMAVDHLSITFPQGSTGLLGANGAGKSSLIKGLLGLVPLSSGSATIMGRDVTREQKAVRQLIGYMPEDDCFIPGLTGVGMVQYAGELSGMSREDAMQRAHEVLFLVGLGEARYRKVESYSSGMKQRIKLAQAIVHDPKLLFLDEPTSGMDPKGRREMLDLIQNISTKGKISIVLASHILVDIESTCERVIMIHNGKIAEEGSVDELRGNYSGAYTVRIEGNKKKFIELLKSKGCEVRFNGKHLIDVILPEKKGTELILKTAEESDVQLRRMVPSIQTLEDVFMKRIGVDQNADL